MRQDLFDFATEVRTFLEDRWVEWRTERFRSAPDVVSESMCRMSSAFLVELLNERFEGDWAVTGGAGVEGGELGDYDRRRWPGGMRSVHNQWDGHYWAMSKSLGLIVDVSADQFGHAPVIVTTADDDRYRGNYLAKAMREHLSQVKRTSGLWLDRWSQRSDYQPPC